MINIVPGREYFFRYGTDGLITQLQAINRWMEEQGMDARVTQFGNLIDDRVYSFFYEDDAIAFKLKFGV